MGCAESYPLAGTKTSMPLLATPVVQLHPGQCVRGPSTSSFLSTSVSGLHVPVTCPWGSPPKETLAKWTGSFKISLASLLYSEKGVEGRLIQEDPLPKAAFPSRMWPSKAAPSLITHRSR